MAKKTTEENSENIDSKVLDNPVSVNPASDESFEKKTNVLDNNLFSDNKNNPASIDSLLDENKLAKNPGALEEKTSGFFDTLKSFSLGEWLSVGAVNVAGALFGGGFLNLASTTLSYIYANYLSNRKKGFTKNNIKTEMYLGGAMTPVLHTVFKVLHTISNPLTRFLAWVPMVPVFNALFMGAEYMFKEYSLSRLVKGLFTGETYKAPFKALSYSMKHLGESVKSVYKFLSVPFYGIINYVPLSLSLPASAVTRTLYRYVLDKSENAKENKNPANMVQDYKKTYKPALTPS